jgi:hypothetical protein
MPGPGKEGRQANDACLATLLELLESDINHDLEARASDDAQDANAIESDAPTDPANSSTVMCLPPVWERLPEPTRRLMDDAMALMDEETVLPHHSPPAGQVSLPLAASTALAAGAADDTQTRPASSQKRACLDRVTAIRIFLAKRYNCGGRSSLSGMLGRRYGMTAKAVRDIWNLRTWAKVTAPFWNAEERQKALSMRMRDR